MCDILVAFKLPAEHMARVRTMFGNSPCNQTAKWFTISTSLFFSLFIAYANAIKCNNIEAEVNEKKQSRSEENHPSRYPS